MVSVPDLLAFFKQLKPSPSIQNAAPTSGKDKKAKLPSPRLTPIDSGLKKTDLPPTPGTPPVATPQSASTDVTPAVPEKSISLFYLLQHYNSANAAAYKAQKAQKKQAKNQAPKEKKEKISKKSKTAMPASSSDFAVPGAEIQSIAVHSRFLPNPLRHLLLKAIPLPSGRRFFRQTFPPFSKTTNKPLLLPPSFRIFYAKRPAKRSVLIKATFLSEETHVPARWTMTCRRTWRSDASIAAFLHAARLVTFRTAIPKTTRI